MDGKLSRGPFARRAPVRGASMTVSTPPELVEFVKALARDVARLDAERDLSGTSGGLELNSHPQDMGAKRNMRRPDPRHHH